MKKRYSINTTNISYEKMDDELVIINFENGSYYTVDTVGSDIWACIEQGESLNDTVSIIDRLYEGDRKEIEGAVSNFIGELQNEALISEKSSDIPDEHSAKGIQEPGLSGDGKKGFVSPVLHKYNDMQELLAADPIHDVDGSGWPNINLKIFDEDINT